jgi:BirA family biotin operon repressor/biotin-[acetyl-CoA-carboxylase] ligase
VTSDGERSPIQAKVIRSDLGEPWNRFDVVPETDSTNADLLARSASGEKIGGSVLVAEFQRAGRGRQGRSWSAPPRSQIAVSVGVNVATVPVESWGWLPLLTGVAVVDAVQETCHLTAGLKWPNDVLVGSRKLAGILAEVTAREPAIVVGIGLNVTMTEEEAPDPSATSLLMLGSPILDRKLLLKNLLRHLAVRISSWQSMRGADSGLAADYSRLSLTLGREVRASLPGDRQIVGLAQSIDAQGRLHIRTGSGVTMVSAGDITHLRPVQGDNPPAH